MTVPTSTAKSGPYAGSGTTGPFTVGFRFLENSHLQVIRTSTIGVDATLALTTDYSVSGAGGASGSVTLVTALSVGEKLTIIRNVPFTQDADYVQNDAFPAESHERALDKLTMQTQQLAETVSRALTLPATSASVSTTLPDAQANKLIGWNSTATGLENMDAGLLATIVAYGTANGDIFTGDGVTTAFNLTASPGVLANLDVAQGGVTQLPGVDYVWTSGTVLTFSVAPPVGVKVLVRYLSALPQGVTDSAASTFLPGGSGAVTTSVQAKLRETISPSDFGVTPQNSPFGKTGLRLAVGEKRDAHYAWASVVEIPNSTKWIMIYRKGTQHGIEDGAEVRATDSYDFGQSWINDRQVQYDVATDSRADRIALMANGRIGFFCNRTSATGPNKYPLFISSDDQGVTWNKLEVPTSSLSYTFASVGGIVAFPSSQGGNDTTGFVSFGYIDATGVDAFTTVNNGNSWATVSNVNGSTVVSENVIIRLGTSDRWLIFVRATPNLLVYKTTNILNWGASVDAGLENLSTPPGGVYDPVTGKVYYFGTARAGKEVDGYFNNILYAGEDADTLWSANGVFTESYRSLVTLPNWSTGYISPFNSKLGLCATVTAGENVANGLPPNSVWLIGNFDVSGADLGMFVDKFTRNLQQVNFLGMTAVDNQTTTFPFVIKNASQTASASYGVYGADINMGGSPTYTYKVNADVLFDIDDAIFGLTAKIPGVTSAIHLGVQGATYPAASSYAGSSSSRKHYIFRNTNGEVGSISTSAAATAFTTTSDEGFKNFIGEYSAQKAIDIIKADPVRDFNWKPEKGGGYAVGWGAQTSFAVSPDLATPGGWFKNDVECAANTPGAIYMPWGIDQSKRTPYLWAAVSYLIDKLADAEARIELLESK